MRRYKLFSIIAVVFLTTSCAAGQKQESGASPTEDAIAQQRAVAQKEHNQRMQELQALGERRIDLIRSSGEVIRANMEKMLGSENPYDRKAALLLAEASAKRINLLTDNYFDSSKRSESGDVNNFGKLDIYEILDNRIQYHLSLYKSSQYSESKNTIINMLNGEYSDFLDSVFIFFGPTSSNNKSIWEPQQKRVNKIITERAQDLEVDITTLIQS